jgi:hypothetical protein
MQPICCSSGNSHALSLNLIRYSLRHPLCPQEGPPQRNSGASAPLCLTNPICSECYIPHMTNLDAIVRELQQERDCLDAAINALTSLGGSSSRTRTGRTMSAAARRKIAAAQRARWAKRKGTGSAHPKRYISPEGLAGIRAATRARWARWRIAAHASQNLSRWPSSFPTLMKTRLYRSARHQERASLISAAQPHAEFSHDFGPQVTLRRRSVYQKNAFLLERLRTGSESAARMGVMRTLPLASKQMRGPSACAPLPSSSTVLGFASVERSSACAPG